MKKTLIILAILACFASQSLGGGVIRINDAATNNLTTSDTYTNALKMGFSASDVPQVDVDALIDFYIATDGPGWTDNTGWLSDPVVGNWYGVTVSGGRVTQLNLASNGSTVDGGFAASDLPSGLTFLRLNNTSSAITGGTSQIQATSITSINISDTSMSQADVDDVLSRIYTDRSLFTDATPELLIGGTNAAPSGTYQYSASPSTGLEYAYSLCNDDDAEGFNSWTITWNGGSCLP